MGLSRASGHASHYICWCVHACARLMPARLPSSPNEASWLCARTKPNWRDGTVLALSALYTPPPRSLPPTLPLLQISWRTMDGWAHTADLEMASVFVKIYVSPDPLARAWIRKSTAPDLPPWLLTTTVFSASTAAAVMLRSAVEQRKGGDIPRGAVRGIWFLTMETETQPMLHIPTVTTIKTQTDKTDPRQHVIIYFFFFLKFQKVQQHTSVTIFQL